MKDSPIWFDNDLSNQRQFIRCIKQMEFMCRKSFSYAVWQKRTKYPVSTCPTCGEDFQWVAPQTHHHPITMFNITENILQKHIDLNDLDDFTDFQIADEIMQSHFNKKVAYVVLCEHCHSKYHSDNPDILEVIDEAQIQQQKDIHKFYNRDISKDKKQND